MNKKLKKVILATLFGICFVSALFLIVYVSALAERNVAESVTTLTITNQNPSDSTHVYDNGT